MKRSSFFTKSLFWVSAVMIMLTLAACRHGGEEKIDYMADRVSKKLEFTEQQQVMWQQLTQELKQIRAEMAGEHGNTKDLLLAELQSDFIDEARVNALFDQHQQAMSAAMQTLLPQITQLHASLSAEQKDILSSYLEKRRDRGHHFH